MLLDNPDTLIFTGSLNVEVKPSESMKMKGMYFSFVLTRVI